MLPVGQRHGEMKHRTIVLFQNMLTYMIFIPLSSQHCIGLYNNVSACVKY